jgi:hypothetical protein
VSNILNGGQIPVAASPNLPEIKVALGQVINKMLKTEYFQVNMPDGERIPNGMVLGLYPDIAVEAWNGKSRCDLPVKPIKLPRDMGVFAIYPKWESNGNYELDKQFIPLQMGQAGMLKSQSLVSDLLGQVGYEVFGGQVLFTKDLTAISPQVKVAMRLVIMDISQYSDYDMLPLPPEMEFDVINATVDLYKAKQGTPDKLADPSVNEQRNIPLPQQRMA